MPYCCVLVAVMLMASLPAGIIHRSLASGDGFLASAWEIGDGVYLLTYLWVDQE